MKKHKKLLIVAIILLLLAFSGLVFWYINRPPSGEEVFNKYIQSSIKLDKFSFEQTGKGTGANIYGYVANDIAAKKYTTNINSECSAKYNDVEVKLTATIQQENDVTYVKLNSASGTYTNSDGGSFDLSKTYINVIGKWYILSKEDLGVKSLLDSGIAAYNSAFLAPNYDTTKLANDIITTKVFSFKSFSESDGKYTFQFVSDKNAYASFLKNSIPNLGNPDLVIENIFGDKSVLDSLMVLDENGVWKEESYPTNNLCANILQIYIGEEAKGIATELLYTAKPKSFETTTFTPVVGAKDISKMQEDMKL